MTTLTQQQIGTMADIRARIQERETQHEEIRAKRRNALVMGGSGYPAAIRLKAEQDAVAQEIADLKEQLTALEAEPVRLQQQLDAEDARAATEYKQMPAIISRCESNVMKHQKAKAALDTCIAAIYEMNDCRRIERDIQADVADARRIARAANKPVPVLPTITPLDGAKLIEHVAMIRVIASGQVFAK